MHRRKSFDRLGNAREAETSVAEVYSTFVCPMIQGNIFIGLRPKRSPTATYESDIGVTSMKATSCGLDLTVEINA